MAQAHQLLSCCSNEEDAHQQQLTLSLVQQRFLSSENRVQKLRKFNMVSKSYQHYYWLHLNTNLQCCQGKFSLNTPLIFLRLCYHTSPTPTGNQTSKMILSPFLPSPMLPFSMTLHGTVILSLATTKHPPLPGSLTTSITSDSWSI